jgi:lysozyme
MKSFTYSERGLTLTKSFEGYRLESYQDSGGVWTIGYGHTGPEVVEGIVWVQDQADAALLADTGLAQACVNKAVTAEIDQNQFDAMVDFTYNAGRGNFANSTLLRKVNASDFVGAAAQFALWVHAGGEVIDGLVRRRKAEAALFAEQTYT